MLKSKKSSDALETGESFESSRLGEWEPKSILDDIFEPEISEFSSEHPLDDLFTFYETTQDPFRESESSPGFETPPEATEWTHQSWEDVLLGPSSNKENVAPLSYVPPKPTKIETKTVNTLDAMRYMMNVIITKDNIKRIALGLSISTILLVASGGGSGLWTFASYLATTAGTKIGSKTAGALASKKLKFLNRKISYPETLVQWSEKLGMPITKDTTYADLLEGAINTSATIAQGGALSFLFSTGLVQGARLGYQGISNFRNKKEKVPPMKVVVASDIKALSSIPEKLIEELSSPTVEKVNLIDFVEVVEEKVVQEITSVPVAVEEKKPVPVSVPTRRGPTKKIDRKKEDIFSRNQQLRSKIVGKMESKKETVDLPVLETVSKGRILAYTASLGTVILGLALGNIDPSAAGDVANATIDIIKENSIATNMISKLVVSAGSGKVSEMLGLTGDQKSSLDSLVKKFSSGDSSVTKGILSLITKGEIYGQSGLKSKTKSELLKIAKERGLKIPGSTSGVKSKPIRKAILAAEAQALAQAQMAIQSILATTAVTAAGSTLASGALDILVSEKGPVEVVDSFGNAMSLPKDVTFDSHKVQKDIDFLKQTMESNSKAFLDAEAARAAAEKATLEASLADAEVQRLANEVSDAMARSLARDAAKTAAGIRAALAEVAAAKDALAAADKIARDAAKAAAAANRLAKESQKFYELTVKTGTDIFTEAELARKALQEAATALQNAVEGGFIVSPDVGPPVGVVSPDLLDPKIQKALDEFGHITPLMNLLASKTAAYGASVLESGGITQTINYWVGAAEFAKNTYKLVKVVESIRSGTELPQIPEMVDTVLSARVPTLSAAVDYMMRADSVDLKKILLVALGDQLAKGADLERLYMDVGRQILWGEGASKGAGISDWMVRQIGSTFYHGIMG